MTSLATALHLAHGDFRERTRRFGFLVTLAVSLYAGYAFLPPNHASYVTLRLGAYRGIYNSAWVGAAISMLTAIFLGLVGFYLIKNAIERDRLSRVGQILAATPLTRFQYVLSKAISNFAVLALIGLTVALSAAVTQLVRAEDTALHPAQFLAPYLFLTLPSMLFIAGVAVCFECIPGLRGGGGNVAYFFVWTIGLAASVQGLRASGLDFLGFGLLLPSMIEACKAAFPDYDPVGGGLSMGLNFREAGVWDLQTFVWDGVDWGPRLLAARALWAAAAVGLVFAASRVFDRFSVEPVPGRVRRRRRRVGSLPAAHAEAPESPAPTFSGHYPTESLNHATLGAASPSHLARLLMAEVRLLLKGASLWWYLVAAGLWIASAVTPLGTARLRVLPLVWIWPVLLWSTMGLRERRFGTDQILFSSPHPVRLQVIAAWLGGVVVALLTGGVIGTRLLLGRDWGGFGAFLVGACFIPSLSLALGVWTGTSRAFEGFYTVFWYIGPLQPIPAIDFMGASPASVESGTPPVFLIATALLLGLALLGRKRQIQS